MALSPLELIVTGSTLLELNPLLQLFKSLRLKRTEELSVSTFATIMTIGGLWLYYGITIHSLPLIIGNAIKLFSAMAVVIIYFVYRKNV